MLGHVDSGKTSLCRALSTVGSTACFDKHPQSKERGITLDLGFSSFVMDLPDHLRDAPYDGVQVTLVDCPGHASLIRTIIGGAQIIDLMMLIVDVGKGVQTQTAECLVIGEITNDKMVVVLNKLDVLPEVGREEKLSKMVSKIQKTLATTKFAEAPIIGVAARPGGGGAAGEATEPTESQGIDELLGLLKSQMTIPQRAPDGPMLFAVDHCFPIKGQGTVLTGTVLSGSIKIGQEIELPELKINRRVKSMQMFKRPVQSASQGDRLGLCVTQLDAKALERGIACTLGHVTLVQQALISVRQIRFHKAQCKTKSKFHITCGHTTVMGTATFFGPPRPKDAPLAAAASSGPLDEKEAAAAATAAAIKLARTPLQTVIGLEEEFEHQDVLDPTRADQWAVLELETPLPCAIPSVLIGSHLDTDTSTTGCRLAFHGMLLRTITREEVEKLRIFKRKQKEGQIDRVQDERTVICKNLFNAGTDMNLFLGMQVQLGEDGPIGRIDGMFGKSKFKVAFSEMEGGVAALQEACKGARIFLKYKRFVFDPLKKMIQ